MAKIKLVVSATIEETFSDFIISRKTKGLAEKTLQSYQSQFQAVARHMDVKMDIAMLQKADLDAMIISMDLPEGQEWVFDMVNNILIEVLGTIAEQERETIRKRQAEGIEAAKANGKKLGRPALTFPANWDKVYASWKAGEITAKTAMEMTDTKRTSFYKLVGMMEE